MYLEFSYFRQNSCSVFCTFGLVPVHVSSYVYRHSVREPFRSARSRVRFLANRLRLSDEASQKYILLRLV